MQTIKNTLKKTFGSEEHKHGNDCICKACLNVLNLRPRFNKLHADYKFRLFLYEQQQIEREMFKDYICDCDYCLGLDGDEWEKYVVEYQKKPEKILIKDIINKKIKI